MNPQLPLFIADEPSVQIPNPFKLLREGASLVLSVSGGKDSDAMCHHLLDLRQSEGWSGDVYMVHADLGARVEWHQTPEYVRNLARRKPRTSKTSDIQCSQGLYCSDEEAFRLRLVAHS